jgi:hypothetical protein
MWKLPMFGCTDPIQVRPWEAGICSATQQHATTAVHMTAAMQPGVCYCHMIVLVLVLVITRAVTWMRVCLQQLLLT